MWERILMESMLTWLLFSFMALPLLSLVEVFPQYMPIGRRTRR